MREASCILDALVCPYYNHTLGLAWHKKCLLSITLFQRSAGTRTRTSTSSSMRAIPTNALPRHMLSVRSSRLTSRMRLACLRLLRLQGLLQSAPQVLHRSANANARTNLPTAWPALLLHVELQRVLDSFRRRSRRSCLCRLVCSLASGPDRLDKLPPH